MHYKAVFFIYFCNCNFSFGKDKLRLLKLTFPENCFILIEFQKEQIVSEIILVESRDLLKIESVSVKTFRENKNLALTITKTRNRLITNFLANKGLNRSMI